MNIQKAILEAQSKDWVAIQRERDILNGNFFVLMGGVIGVHCPIENQRALYPGWEPSVEDLIADDWYPYRFTKKNFEALQSCEVLKLEKEQSIPGNFGISKVVPDPVK
ncbi:hypothetical protein [Faecalibaculum rodentium]|uniref:hypothetical protein n=1 Tax=Faecalibaculum rodentium TaxID=1702221 RepID=UPI002594FE5A|nr:hypothetical protein [Faecalibaculum rodentium]